MPEDDDYELLPMKQIHELRQEVDNLKKNPLGNTNSAKDLFEAVENLTAAVNYLTDIIKNSLQAIKDDEVHVAIQEKTNEVIQDKITKLNEQNEQIAKGIVALSEMIKQQEEKRKLDHLQRQRLAQKPVNPQPMQPKFQNADLPAFNPFDATPGQTPNFAPPGQEPFPDFNQPFPQPQFNQQPQFGQPQFNPQIGIAPQAPMPPPEKKGFFKF